MAFASEASFDLKRAGNLIWYGVALQELAMYEHLFGKTPQVSIREADLKCALKYSFCACGICGNVPSLGRWHRHWLSERRDSAVLWYLFAQEQLCGLSEFCSF